MEFANNRDCFVPRNDERALKVAHREVNHHPPGVGEAIPLAQRDTRYKCILLKCFTVLRYRKM